MLSGNPGKKNQLHSQPGTTINPTASPKGTQIIRDTGIKNNQ